MKVACIGNMNNNFFAITRYLRDQGIDADLLLLNWEQSHFTPENDTFTNNNEFIKQLSWGDIHSFYYTTRSRIRQDLKDYEFLIICSTVPAFLTKIGRTADLFLPYGADIMDYPHLFPANNIRNYLKNIYYTMFRKYQRKGIQASMCISQEDTIPLTRKWLEALGVQNRNYYLGFPMVYDGEYAPGQIDKFYLKSRWYKEFKELRDKYEFLILHHASHRWHNTFRNKGNNLVIEGFARLLSTNPALSVSLILFEYGADVNESKKLINKLGISKNIKWLPQMPRREIMIGISLCDIVAGEFGFGFIGCGVVWETLIAGKPLIANRNDSDIPNSEDFYPHIQANSADEICHALQNYMADKESYIEMGKAGRKWIVEDYSKSIDKIILLINSKKEGKDISAVVQKWKKESAIPLLN